MTDTLGYLIWWKVGDVDLDHDQLEKVLAADIPLPPRPIPIDVYRRVTGPKTIGRYDLSDSEHYLELSLVPIDAKSDKMSTRHIVGTMKTHTGQPVLVRKAGDVAFYKPPRGKNSKARMRVTTIPPLEGWAGPVGEFADQLRFEYEQGVKGVLDDQAIRRLIRAYLTREQHAVYLDGPWFIEGERGRDARIALEPLFEALGEDSFIHSVPLPDSDYDARFLARYQKEEEEADE